MSGSGGGCADAAALGRRGGARAVDVLLGAAAMAAGALLLGIVTLVAQVNVLFASAGPGASSARAVLAAAAVAAHAAYELYWTVRYSTTPGKTLLGLGIADSHSGDAVTVRQAVERHAVLHGPVSIAYVAAVSQTNSTGQRVTMAIGAACWALTSASPLWDRQRLGWHDKAAGTTVTRIPPGTDASG